MRSRVILVAAVSALCLVGGLGAFEAGSPQGAPARPPTTAELSAAEAILRASGLIESVAGRADWHFVRPSAFESDDSHLLRTGVNFPEPVAASGNWFILQCGGTQVWESTSSWTDVYTIHVVIDLATEEVVSLGVGASFSETDRDFTHGPTRVSSGEMIRIRDARSGKFIRLVQADIARCPGLANGN